MPHLPVLVEVDGQQMIFNHIYSNEGGHNYYVYALQEQHSFPASLEAIEKNKEFEMNGYKYKVIKTHII